MSDPTQLAAEAAKKVVRDICDYDDEDIYVLIEESTTIIKTAIESYVSQPKEIPLTNGKFATVDHQDFISLAGLTWHCTSHGRAATGKTNYMHRVIAAQMGIVGEVDHIDGNPLNNRRSNLRGCTRTQNQANTTKSRGDTSWYKGVHWSKSHDAWVAQIKQNEKVTYLGQFDVELDAALIYDAAALQAFGEFAKLNFPILRQIIEKATEELRRERDCANEDYHALQDEASTVCLKCGDPIKIKLRAAHASENCTCGHPQVTEQTQSESAA